jgi:hypothetical protein
MDKGSDQESVGVTGLMLVGEKEQNSVLKSDNPLSERKLGSKLVL